MMDLKELRALGVKAVSFNADGSVLCAEFFPEEAAELSTEKALEILGDEYGKLTPEQKHERDYYGSS